MIKGDLMDMLNDFYVGYLDISRLNYTLHERKGTIFKIDFEKAHDAVNWNFVDEFMMRKWILIRK